MSRWPFRSHRTLAQIAEHRAVAALPRALRTPQQQRRFDHLRRRANAANRGLEPLCQFDNRPCRYPRCAVCPVPLTGRIL